MGIKALRKIQLGKESVAGTAVAATTIWRGMGLLEDRREVVHVDEHIGVALPSTRAYIPKELVAITFDPVEATWQQLPYIFEGGISVETPTQDGTGAGYIYAYAFPTTTLNTLETYTMEVGDNTLVQESDYCFVESFNISGAAGEAVMMSANWLGRTTVDASFTGGLSVPALTAGDHILVAGSTLSIDDDTTTTTVTIGTTAVSNSLLSFNLDVTTGYRPKWTNTAKDFDFVYWDRDSFDATLTMVFEHDSNANTERDDFEAGTVKLVQLKFVGDTITPATGATYTTETFIINAAGVYTSAVTSDQDGNSTVELTMKIGYSAYGSAQGLDFIVVNELTSLP